MTDKVKLIIEIPLIEYAKTCNNLTLHNRTFYDEAIRNGIPLDDVKAEIQTKEMVETDIEKQFYNMALGDVMQILDNIGKAESEEEVNGKNE